MQPCGLFSGVKEMTLGLLISENYLMPNLKSTRDLQVTDDEDKTEKRARTPG